MENAPPCTQKDLTLAEDFREEWRIMLLGKTGAGKSSSGNTILGKEAFKSDIMLSRVTYLCEKERVEIDGRPLVVADTPGLFETKRSEREVMREILKTVSLCKPGPHAFVVVIPLGRFTLEDQETNRLIESTFSEAVWRYTIVLFTHGDRMEGKTLNSIIQSGDKSLREFIRKCSGGFLIFNNKDPGNRQQVAKLLEKLESLVALNGGSFFTSSMYPAPERKIREVQERILAQKDREIARKERELEEYHKGEELERKKKELWRKEEDQARRQAENQPTLSSQALKFIVYAAFGAAFGFFTIGESFGSFIGVAMAMILKTDAHAHLLQRLQNLQFYLTRRD